MFKESYSLEKYIFHDLRWMYLPYSFVVSNFILAEHIHKNFITYKGIIQLIKYMCKICMHCTLIDYNISS